MTTAGAMPRMMTFLRRASLLGTVTVLAGSTILCAAPAAEHMRESKSQNAQGARVETMAASTASIELSGGPVNVTLSPDPAQQGTRLASRLSSLAPGERIYLVLKDLAAQQQPGVTYLVYLDQPAGSVPDKNDPHYVGVLNFYSVRTDGSSLSRSFDVTDNLRNLQKQNLLSDQTTITIIPSRGSNINAKPVIGRIELDIQASSS